MKQEFDLPNEDGEWRRWNDEGWIYFGVFAYEGKRLCIDPGAWSPREPEPGRWRKVWSVEEEDKIADELCTVRCLLKRICDGINREESSSDDWLEAGEYLDSVFPSEPQSK